MQQITKIAICSGILLGMYLLSVPAFGAYADIPKEPEVHFTYRATQIVPIQTEFDASVNVVDDRSSYYKWMKITPLKNANVTLSITASNSDKVIDKQTGKTNKYGFWAGSELVTNHGYSNHGLYNATITVQYGDSIDVKTFQFWTYTKNY